MMYPYSSSQFLWQFSSILFLLIWTCLGTLTSWPISRPLHTAFATFGAPGPIPWDSPEKQAEALRVFEIANNWRDLHAGRVR